MGCSQFRFWGLFSFEMDVDMNRILGLGFLEMRRGLRFVGVEKSVVVRLLYRELKSSRELRLRWWW